MHKPHLLKSDQLYEYLLKSSLRETSHQKKLRDFTVAHVHNSQMMLLPEQAQFLGLLIEIINAKQAIEIGVFTGYSSLAIALALPEDGQLISCDIEPQVTEIGQTFWKDAEVSHKISLKIAPALSTLQSLLNDGKEGAFDFVFIDADKANYQNYYELSLRLIRKGGLIVFDNVLATASDLVYEQKTKTAQVLDQLNQSLLHDQRVSISMVPIGKGMTVVRKR